MSDGDAKRSHVRIAAAILAAILVAATVFTYLAYTAAFTVDRHRHGDLSASRPGDGAATPRSSTAASRSARSKSIEYAGDQAKLTLAINSNELRYIPSNAGVRIAGTTVFGAKSVEFLPPEQPSGPLRPGADVQAADVQLEVNTLFQTLTDVLHKIDPVNLNATLTALAEGLRGNGDDLGATLAGLNYYLQQLNPKLPTLQEDLQKTAVGRQHLRRRRPRSGHDLRQRARDQQHHRRRAGQPERDAARRHRTGQQRHRHAGARRERLHRRHPAAAGAVEGGRRLLAGVRLHLAGYREGDRSLRPDHRRHPAGPVRRVQLPARLAGLHVSGEPADRERLRRTELPWPAEPADQAVRRFLVPHAVPGHRQRVRPVPAEHRVAVRRAVDGSVPVQRRLRGTGRY